MNATLIVVAALACAVPNYCEMRTSDNPPAEGSVDRTRTLIAFDLVKRYHPGCCCHSHDSRDHDQCCCWCYQIFAVGAANLGLEQQ